MCKLFWTTVQHTWSDHEHDIKVKCELWLIYMGPGKFAEYIPLMQIPDSNELSLKSVEVMNTPEWVKNMMDMKATGIQANKKLIVIQDQNTESTRPAATAMATQVSNRNYGALENTDANNRHKPCPNMLEMY